MSFRRRLRLLRTGVQSTVGIRATKKFYDDGNITTAIAGQNARRELRSQHSISCDGKNDFTWEGLT